MTEKQSEGRMQGEDPVDARLERLRSALVPLRPHPALAQRITTGALSKLPPVWVADLVWYGKRAMVFAAAAALVAIAVARTVAQPAPLDDALAWAQVDEWGI